MLKRLVKHLLKSYEDRSRLATAVHVHVLYPIHQFSVHVAQAWQAPREADCSTAHPLLKHDSSMLAHMTTDDAYDVRRQSDVTACVLARATLLAHSADGRS